LLADVVLIASGKPDGILHQEDSDRLHQWADRLWPMGVTQCGQAIEDARHDMARNVAARLVFEALVSHFQAALQSP
jgi:hypothetical protein